MKIIIIIVAVILVAYGFYLLRIWLVAKKKGISFREAREEFVKKMEDTADKMEKKADKI
jgi:flagellar basal body-associated protein FliL